MAEVAAMGSHAAVWQLLEMLKPGLCRKLEVRMGTTISRCEEKICRQDESNQQQWAVKIPSQRQVQGPTPGQDGMAEVSEQQTEGVVWIRARVSKRR